MARGELNSLAGLPLHAVGKRFQLKYIVVQCEELVEGLDGFIERTRQKAPLRRGDFVLEREPGRKPNAAEATLEQELWEKYRSAGSGFLPGLCSHIQSYQVSLHSRKNERPGGRELKFDWGEIDLLGVSPSGLPVVVELKKGETNETPLRILTEMLAYTIALQELWKEGCFRKAWKSVVAEAKDGDLPHEAIGIAPVEYWRRVRGQSGPRGRVPPAGWAALARLVEKLAEKGFNIHFAEFDRNRRVSLLPPLSAFAK